MCQSVNYISMFAQVEKYCVECCAIKNWKSRSIWSRVPPVSLHQGTSDTSSNSTGNTRPRCSQWRKTRPDLLASYHSRSSSQKGRGLTPPNRTAYLEPLTHPPARESISVYHKRNPKQVRSIALNIQKYSMCLILYTVHTVHVLHKYISTVVEGGRRNMLYMEGSPGQRWHHCLV